jgi:type III pantothenate kinase
VILLFDIGNTRIKWAELSAAGIGQQFARVHADLTREQLTEIVRNVSSRPSAVLVANVRGATFAQLLSEVIAQVWQIECEFIESSATAGGVRNAYPEPGNLGVDRWLGLIAAHAMYRRSACIVGVGTAMTVDGVDAHGQHLGGLIVPGPDLMVTSLLRNTSEIARRAASGEVRTGVFADNTLGAIEQGSVHALAALAERAIAALRTRVADDPVLVLTGGASARISALIGMSHESVPDLVLRGLAVLAANK